MQIWAGQKGLGERLADVRRRLTIAKGSAHTHFIVLLLLLLLPAAVIKKDSHYAEQSAQNTFGRSQKGYFTKVAEVIYKTRKKNQQNKTKNQTAKQIKWERGGERERSDGLCLVATQIDKIYFQLKTNARRAQSNILLAAHFMCVSQFDNKSKSGRRIFVFIFTFSHFHKFSQFSNTNYCHP